MKFDPFWMRSLVIQSIFLEDKSILKLFLMTNATILSTPCEFSPPDPVCRDLRCFVGAKFHITYFPVRIENFVLELKNATHCAS